MEINLHDYLNERIAVIDARIGELEERINLKHGSMETAINKAETALSYRLEGMNEFRRQLDAQSSQFIPRKEAELKIKNSTEGLSLQLKVLWALTASMVLLIVAAFITGVK